MAKIERFEDIEAWKKARLLVELIYQETGKGAFAKDFDLRDQIRRAAVSIMSNIAEGFERNSDKEFRQFLYISKGSAGEVRSLLYVVMDLNYINKTVYESLMERVIFVSQKLSGFIKYLESKN